MESSLFVRQGITAGVSTFLPLFSPIIPIISVGSVDVFGGVSSFSPRGSAITISTQQAIIYYYVAREQGVAGSSTKSGTSVAASAVAGLAAYLLSLPGHWTDAPGKARNPFRRAVKQYLIGMGYVRSGSTI